MRQPCTYTLNQSSPSAIGKKTQILGPNFKEIARYELREIDEVIPSHDPERQFARRPDYPEIAQERPYHSDEGEQQKVVGNALGYEPGLVISTDASATNGPPIITKNGIVLGGNSRAMTLQLVYGQQPEKAAAYRQMLMDNAAQFGIDPQAVAAMKKPMLARVVSGDLNPEQMAKRSREYNQTTTQQLQGEAEGISRARFVDGKSLGALVEGLKDGKTIGEFLAGPDSANFVILLQDAGVLQQSEIAALTTKSGRLNDAGKARVMQILRGLVLPDYDIMASLPKGVLTNLDTSIPGLALSRLRGDGWDLTGAFYEAMRLTAEAKNKGIPVEQHFSQHVLDGNVDPMRDNPVVQALAMLFAKADPKELRMRMEHYLALADLENAGQNTLIPGAGIQPKQAFRKVFLEPLAFVGSERVVNFNPDGNGQHAAIKWAVENGGKSPTIEKALDKLEKLIAKKKIDPEEKARLTDYRKELSPFSGAVGIREPKLGEFWKNPEKIEIPEGKKPGERGALPEATQGLESSPLVLEDPDVLLPPELQENPQPVARGSVRFGSELDKPIVTFFQASDFSTAPHELFHIFRREMERTAMAADGSLHAKEQWRRLCEFVGAKPCEKWTVQMEERFANAGLRYLAEGKAPSPSLQGIFTRIKNWLMELFQRAEEIGVEISPEMRKAFDEMFAVPYEKADHNFRMAMGELHKRELERDFADPDGVGKPLADDDKRLADIEQNGDLQLAEELMQESLVRADEAAARLERSNPDLRQAIEEANAEIARIDEGLAGVDKRDELRRQAVECLFNGG